MKTSFMGKVGGLVIALPILFSCSSPTTTEYKPEDLSKLERVKQKLVAPPFLPEHTQKAVGGYKIVEVEMSIEEKKMVIDDKGTEVWAFAYEGSVPGPMIVVHEGDYVEVKLINPKTNSMEHNVDFHSATGALGGGGLTHVAPGEEVTMRFRATKAGVFVYHCAPGGVMIPWHVVHGMNGAIMVLPRDGLNDGKGNSLTYDKAFYIGEQDYYIAKGKGRRGRYKKYDTATASYSDDLKVMETLTPSHIVFNGAVGSLTGDNAMKASVGDRVLFIHEQANRDTRPHLIGGHGDFVWERGSFTDVPQTGLETWFIAGGSAGAAFYTFKQPGVYAYVNHNLIEGVMKGATAHVVVDGKWDDDLMKQLKKPAPIK
jgi:nitrite reductase (NO-forming)